MTDAIAFDTQRFVKRLTESGFTTHQAETLAEEHVAPLHADLAIKADIAKAKAGIARVGASVETLRQETKARIAEAGATFGDLYHPIITRLEWLRVEFLKCLFVGLTVQGGLVVALVKLL